MLYHRCGGEKVVGFAIAWIKESRSWSGYAQRSIHVHCRRYATPTGVTDGVGGWVEGALLHFSTDAQDRDREITTPLASPGTNTWASTSSLSRCRDCKPSICYMLSGIRLLFDESIPCEASRQLSDQRISSLPRKLIQNPGRLVEFQTHTECSPKTLPISYNQKFGGQSFWSYSAA